MPRAGLSPEAVTEAALELAEQVGLHGLSLAALAERLGVRPPSLYKHVESLDALKQRVVALHSAALASALEQAALGRAREDATRRLARTYLAFARARPRLFEALPPSHVGQSAEVVASADRILRVLFAVFEGYGLAGADRVHVARSFRAAVHGFAMLEATGGFGLDVSVDQSFDFLVDTLIAGVSARAAEATPAPA